MRREQLLAILNTLIFGGVILVNFQANALPINGLTTGQISDMYPNLFVPAGLTFSIWGVIYLMMLAFVVYQMVVAFGKDRESIVFAATGFWFIISSLANLSWILAWHYLMPVISLGIMIVLLLSLIMIYTNLEDLQGHESAGDRRFVTPFFSVYMGWISVATIANTTALLVHLGWKGIGIDPNFWAILMIAIASILGIYLQMRKQDIFFAAVIVWALFGIYLKQSAGEQKLSPIIIAAFIGIAVNLIGIFVLLLRKKKQPAQ